MNNFKTALVCGRFQTFHAGHEQLIDMALKLSDKVLILIGSAQISNTKRNPFDINLRIEMLKAVYKDNPRIIIGQINDLSKEDEIASNWGEYLLEVSKSYLSTYPELMVYGNDESRSRWFKEGILKNTSELIVKRNGLSATIVREYMIKNDYDKWKESVNEAIYPFYNIMRKQLLEGDKYE